jgi:hypothetical protein
MARHPLDGVRAKLDRADEHLQAFDEEVPEFLATDPYAFHGQLDRDARRYPIVVEISGEPPLRWATIAGDFVQNTRGALDHLVWQLALLAGNQPGRANQFPILDTAPADTRAEQNFERMLAGVGPDARQRIEFMQPYQQPDDPAHHVLNGLREMSNADKHRTLLVTATAIPEHDWATLRFRGNDDVGELGQYGIHVNKPLAEGKEIAFLEDIDIRGPAPEIEIDGHFPFQVAFGDDLTTLTGLRQTLDYARNIVESEFAPLF